MTESAADWVFDATDADFERSVIDASRDRPVVVDFWAPWCQPCRTLGPILERLVAARNGQVLLAKVNVDENPGLAEAFGIQSIPAVKAVRDGRLVLQFEGVLPEEHLNAFLDQGDPLRASASSVNSMDPRQRPGAAVDGDLRTGWTASPAFTALLGEPGAA